MRTALFALTTVVTVICPVPAVSALPETQRAADQTVLTSYPLTLATLHRMRAAITTLKAAEERDPSLRDEEHAIDGQAPSLAAALASYRAHSRVAAFFRRAGVEDRDAVLFPLAIMVAAIAAASPEAGAPAPVNAAQVQFYNANRAEIASTFDIQ